ncbi:hypothetical protein [Microbacterium sp. Root553]|uniref:hypothetical protein n=1 Tax=Microbacterium sp. Root553 TaxID=1736556 RepID=UPI0006F5F3F5|nr:hypothetical protein [Microbacterium sp. Root553]KQZ23779.1 hypothetical protein ASD43_04975 [Microbacterium sp. Root553]
MGVLLYAAALIVLGIWNAVLSSYLVRRRDAANDFGVVDIIAMRRDVMQATAWTVGVRVVLFIQSVFFPM